MNTKICPFRKKSEHETACVEFCQLWDDRVSDCSLKQIAKELSNVCNQLNEIVKILKEKFIYPV